MIDPAIEEMLTENKAKFLIPGNVVANVQDSNNLYHAFLVLTKNRYSKIVVLDNDGKYRGLISLSMITEQMLATESIEPSKLKHILVSDVMQTDAATVCDPYDFERDLNLLTDDPFIPVVAENGDFTGIVTRREILKALNSFVHTFNERYDITEKVENKI